MSISKPDNAPIKGRSSSTRSHPSRRDLYTRAYAQLEKGDLFRRSSVLYQAGIMPSYPGAVFSDDLAQSRVAETFPRFACLRSPERKENLFRRNGRGDSYLSRPPPTEPSSTLPGSVRGDSSLRNRRTGEFRARKLFLFIAPFSAGRLA